MSHECCEGVRGLRFSRRYFLKQGGIALVGMSAMPAFLQRAAAATAMPNKKQAKLLPAAADDCDSAASAWRGGRGHRFGWLFRVASEPCAAGGAVSK